MTLSNHQRIITRKLGLRCLFSSAALGWNTAHAQQVFVPSSSTYGQIPTVDQAAAGPIGSLTASLTSRLFALQTIPLQAGPVEFHPKLGYQFQYGDGILNSPGDDQTTALNTISPGLALQIGQNWFADLDLGINLYSNPEFRDWVGYTFAFGGRIPFEEWTVNLGLNGNLSDGTQLETATQTEQWTQNLVASGVRSFSSRVSIELSASQNIQLTQLYNDQYTWSTLNWLNYQATPKTSVGFGLGAGYNLIEPGIDSVFEQLQGRVSWLPAPKISVQLSGGVQFQQFLNPNGVDDGVFPLFGALVVYRPVDPTSILFSASHTVGTSLYTAQFTETTTVAVGLNQRLLRNFNLSVLPSYNFTQYQTTFGGLVDVSEYNYFYLYVGVSTTLFKKLGTSVFYRFNDDQSSIPGYSFSGSIVGFSLNYRY